ncbi:uncharacterized protein LOC135341813 isoform X2 [Halichondria panicea]|uniref:uncharacterized protein LOC135341813 isoform X2 n=1 Tax=Halichondria panicea TaxID=6063 RepID=UPI00312B462F
MNSPLDKDSQKRRLLFNPRALAAQKTFRARQTGFVRRLSLWCITILSFVLAWAIGHLQVSPVLLVLLLLAMVVIWRDQAGKILQSAHQETEIKLRRHKTIHQSETAEWVNVALNKWWTTCSDSVLVYLKDYIEPLLEEIAPVGVDSVELVECDLSDQTPVISNVQVLDPPHSTKKSDSVDIGECRRTMLVNFDLSLPSPDSKVVLRARLGGKKLGCSTLVYVEGLHVSGSIHAAVVIDKDAPFPHIASITATFVRRPNIWFNVRVLKGLRVTEIPILKSWIHNFIMDVFTTLLVNPGKLSLDFMSTAPVGHSLPESSKRALGVLTVTVQGSTPPKNGPHTGDPRLRCALRMGDQKHQGPVPPGKKSWTNTHSFFIYSLQEDVLVVKMKLRRMVTSQTLSLHPVGLDSMNFTNQYGEVTQRHRSVTLSNPEAILALKLTYTPLPPVSLSTLNGFNASNQAGVVYVYIHSAAGLLSADADGLSDPYCVVLANKRKVLTTHYVLDNLNPQWERGVEFFISDLSQTSLTFLVYDWDGPLVGDDLLGATKLTLTQDRPEVLQECLDLNMDGVTSKDGISLGQLTVSVVFRPVDSVANCDVDTSSYEARRVSELEKAILASYSPSPEGRKSILESNRKEVKKVAKLLLGRRKNKFSSSEGVLELSVLRGRNLVPKDSNGLSDPYIVVKYGGATMFRSRVVKKSLNPDWDESATLSPPSTDEIIKVECWDKDRFSDDFMGSIRFTEQDLAQFQDDPQWCKLQHVPTGEVLIGMKKVLPMDQDNEWMQLDEASRPFVEVPLLDEQGVGGKVLIKTESSCTDSSGDEQSSEPLNTLPSTESESTQSFPLPANDICSTHSIPVSTDDKKSIRRRHTLTHSQRMELSRRASWAAVPSHGSDDLTHKHPQHLPRYPQTKADIERALKGDTGSIGSKRGLQDRGTARVKQPMVYHNVAGQVIEADGLKGELNHLELYIKVRLNSRPSYQRQQRFGRGPVVHKTRVLRGSRNPQWKEDFMVKESPVPSDSLLTLDLKSGSKINIGTQAITLDKFFEGNLKATRSMDLGNDMKLRVRLTRQPTPQSSPMTASKSVKHKRSRQVS